MRRVAVRVLPPAARSALRRVAGNLGVTAAPETTDVGGGVLAAATVDVESAAGVTVEQWSVWQGTLVARLRFDARARDVRSVLVLFAATTEERPVGPAKSQVVTLTVPVPTSQNDHVFHLGVRRGDGTVEVLRCPGDRLSGTDPYHQVFVRFAAELRQIDAGAVLEVGSRARSGNVYRGIVPDHLDYVGLDVKGGPNVDVVGDAHDLASVLAGRRFRAAFSIAVFEHLLMPWKVAVEINRVLEPGGLLFVGSHQTFPLHEEPWDFFRYSEYGWHGLFNAATGFEVLAVAMGEPVILVANALTASTWRMDESRAFLGCAVLCRKTADTALDWPVDPSTIVSSLYPA